MEQGTTGGSAPRKSGGRKPGLRVEVGQRFGLGVITDPDARVGARNLRGAHLICECGKEYSATLQHLLSGHRRSCGCLRGQHLVARVGLRYGKLLVVEYLGTKPRKTGTSRWTLWLCRCDCGNESVVEGVRLASGSTTSCGCSRKRPRNADDPQAAARSRVLKTYKRSARERDLAWELADEEFGRLTALECSYCGQPPSRVYKTPALYGDSGFTYNGLDRVDNTLGYVPGNVVPCCRTCNIAKNDMTYDDFMAWIARLLDYHLLKGAV